MGTMIWRTGWAWSLSAAVLLFGAATWAEESGLTPREKMLLDKVDQLEKRVADLEKQAASKAAAPAAAEANPAAPEQAQKLEERVGKIEKDLEKKPNDFRVFWKEGLRFETADQRFKLKIGGRLHNDWAFFHDTEELRTAVGEQEDGTEFRRARINIQGEIYDNIEFRTEYDFANDAGNARFQDVYIGMKGLPGVGNVRVGHFKEPFSLEALASSNYLTFMERSLPFAFAPFRNLGIMAFNTELDDRLTWAIGAFKNTDDFPSGDDSDEDQGFSVTARVTGLPWYQDEGRKLLHLGAAYSHRNPDGAVLGYNTRPEAHLAKALVNTERFKGFRFLDARMSDANLYNAEGLFIYGPFSLQGEYSLANVETTFSGSHDLDGWYVQASYLLTGENRSYDKKAATFSRVVPKHSLGWSKERGWGAWELALRYSTIDLDSGIIRGGTQNDLTAGVNWYLNPNTRIMLNYVLADVNHDLYDGQLDVLQARFQVDF